MIAAYLGSIEPLISTVLICIHVKRTCTSGAHRERTIDERQEPGERHDQPPGKPQTRQSDAMRGLRGQVWPRSALPVANAPLFPEVHRPLQDTGGKRPELAVLAADGLQ